MIENFFKKEFKNTDVLKLINKILKEIKFLKKAISVEDIGAGMTHQNKIITLEDKIEIILRYIPPGLHPNPARREDSYFGGERSVFREAKLLDIARNQAGLPASKVIYANDRREEGKILIVQKVPGITFRDYIAKNYFSHDHFLKGLAFLGEDIAKAHSLNFDLYGSIQKEGIRNGKKTYSDYLSENIIDRHFEDHLEILEKYYSKEELEEINIFFKDAQKDIKSLDESKIKPCFVLYDQHTKNFMVGDNGRPSGYFDIEYGQAAHPSLEFGSIVPQLFCFFSGDNEKQAKDYIKQAREAFTQGYLRMDGEESINNETLEIIHIANHIFSAIKSYAHFKEGPLAGFSQAFAEMALGIARERKINCFYYFTDLRREATKQPKHPK